MRKWYLLIWAFSLVFACFPALADIKVLFDENAPTEAAAGIFPDLFTGHDAGSKVEVSTKDPFKGKYCAFVTPSQSYNNQMKDWKFPIVEKPKAGEYRYIIFAWKSDGGTGVMIQFPDNGNWGAVTTPCVEPPAPGTRRYIAGTNVTGWSGICVSKEIPTKWTVVERDLFADFGAFTITGIALTPFSDGGAGDYYDMIIIGSEPLTISTFVSPTETKLATTWGDVKYR